MAPARTETIVNLEEDLPDSGAQAPHGDMYEWLSATQIYFARDSDRFVH